MTLTVPVGPPGAGKTTWAQAHVPAATVLSLDAYRARLCGSAAIQARNADVVAALHRDLHQRLAAGLDTVVDATSTIAAHRAALLAIAAAHHTPARAVVFTTALAECLRRNAARDRQVPERVIEIKHAEVAKLTVAALFAEGFADVTFA